MFQSEISKNLPLPEFIRRSNEILVKLVEIKNGLISKSLFKSVNENEKEEILNMLNASIEMAGFISDWFIDFENSVEDEYPDIIENNED